MRSMCNYRVVLSCCPAALSLEGINEGGKSGSISSRALRFRDAPASASASASLN